MRESKPGLTPELELHRGAAPIWKAPAFTVSGYRALVEHVARLAYANPDELLFFRGQDKDYQSKSGGTTLYPAIYRGDSLASRELRHRFEQLELFAKLLVDRFKRAGIEGHRDLRKKRYIQWSILQHYEVLPTPLLDLTQSLRVACSFAQLTGSSSTCYLYVFGLPYLSNRISINSEHDIVNVRLLSICPPAALRPYFQEGYLAGTTDTTTDFDSKTELDFRNRLIAKFAIPRARAFWGAGFEQMPETALYPKGDTVDHICRELRDDAKKELKPGAVGEFIKEWSDLEELLLENGRRMTARNVSVREAIAALSKAGEIGSEHAQLLQTVREFRNNLVHHAKAVEPTALNEWLASMRELRKGLGLKDA